MKLYRNNKTGGIYELLFKALDATSNRGARVAIYQHIETEKIFVRDESEFYKKFTKQ